MIAALVLGIVVAIPHVKPDPVRAAVVRAVPNLVAGATGHAELKTCFGCHNQAFPALALTAARDRGFDVPAAFFREQADHISAFLTANKARFLEGEGTGGGVDTAGYALFTLALAGHKPDDTTAAVAEYILKSQPDRDHWRANSNRPPTEASDFTTTYVALRGLRTYAAKDEKDRVEKRVAAARGWLLKAAAKDTEDRVFRLLALKEAAAGENVIAAAAWELIKTQRTDGGWAQLDAGASDAYATGSALHALHHVGTLKANTPAYRAGVAFLLKTQLPDGTWKVKSRSKPFQPYYESGFPHEKDQFISISASGWATAALAAAVEK